jgi:hypothetical protein
MQLLLAAKWPAPSKRGAILRAGDRFGSASEASVSETEMIGLVRNRRDWREKAPQGSGWETLCLPAPR